jgi:hypothetical protein
MDSCCEKHRNKNNNIYNNNSNNNNNNKWCIIYTLQKCEIQITEYVKWQLHHDVVIKYQNNNKQRQCSHRKQTIFLKHFRLETFAFLL